MPADNTRHLTPQQHTVIQRLLLGATITEAAQAAGVTRQTVSEWSNHHGPFQAEHAEQRSYGLRDARQQLEQAAQIAADDTVAPAIRIKASEAILERCGF